MMSDEDCEPLSPDANEAAPEETLQLLRAFHRIADPGKRQTILTLAQQLAAGSPLFANTLAKLIRKH